MFSPLRPAGEHKTKLPYSSGQGGANIECFDRTMCDSAEYLYATDFLW